MERRGCIFDKEDSSRRFFFLQIKSVIYHLFIIRLELTTTATWWAAFMNDLKIAIKKDINYALKLFKVLSESSFQFQPWRDILLASCQSCFLI